MNMTPPSSCDKSEITRLIQSQQISTAHERCKQLCLRHPNDAEVWFLMGAINGQLGDFSVAEKCCRRALELAPGQPALLTNLGVALLHQGKTEEAKRQLQAATRADASNAAAWLELANTYKLSAEPREALRAYERVLTLRPGAYAVHYNLALTLLELDRDDDASRHLAQAIKFNNQFLDAYLHLSAIYIQRRQFRQAGELLKNGLHALPGNAELYFRLGVACQEQGETNRAIECYRQALESEPAHVDAHIGIAGVLGLEGNYDEAHQILRKILAVQPPTASLGITFANLASRIGAEREATDMLLQLLKEQHTERIRSKLEFALASLYDRAGEYDTAFEYFRSANLNAGTRFDARTCTDGFNRLKAVFYSSRSEPRVRTSDNSLRPVFIVGLPRSGTSLAEQILATHPKVFGAGELPLIHELPERVRAIAGMAAPPYPQCLNLLTCEQLEALAQEYFAHLKARSETASWVVDKAPINFLHLGLIDRMFPDARIIHCMRDPMDTCLSCYFHDFSGDYAYAYDLRDLGFYYRLYESLMHHWRKHLDIAIHNVRYEDIVNKPEREIRRMLAFCGLNWDPACMEFHKTKRTVATASHSQVRRPLYSSSIGRWRNYESHLADLSDALYGGD